MRAVCITILLLVLTTVSYSQQFILLEKAGTFKNYKYFTGDDISLILKSDGRRIDGQITRIGDSTFVINNQEEFWLGDVMSVVKSRFFFSYFGYGAMIGGAFYLSLDAVNRVITGDTPVVTSETAVIGGALIGSGWLMSLFKERKIHVGKDRRWRLRIMPSIGRIN